jgi:hypothetical protein
LTGRRRRADDIVVVAKLVRRVSIILELGKEIVRSTLASLQARSGRKIEFQDEEARNSGFGG